MMVMLSVTVNHFYLIWMVDNYNKNYYHYVVCKVISLHFESYLKGKIIVWDNVAAN